MRAIPGVDELILLYAILAHARSVCVWSTPHVLSGKVHLQDLARHGTLVNGSQLAGAFDPIKREHSSKA
jgi:hypothetical protein